MKKTFPLLLLGLCLGAALLRPASAAPPALVLSDPALPDADPALVRSVAEDVRAAGWAPVSRTVAELGQPGALAPGRCALLVLPQARALPAILAPALYGYLQAGGHLLALGVPAWGTSLVAGPGGKWITSAEAGEAQALTPPPHPVFDFGRLDLTAWRRSSNDLTTATQETVTPVEVGGRRASALHVVISDLNGWDTFNSPPVTSAAFPGGRTMTVFSAKGGPRTSGLSIEWDEKDGSRWIATIPLTPRWQRYSLPPSAFHTWQNTDGRAPQGFHPENADRLAVGLAFSHTGGVGGKHEYWVSSLGTATPEEAPAAPSEAGKLAPLETLTPAYKFFPIHGPIRLAGGAITPPMFPESSQPRPSGAGYAKGRGARWVSLLDAADAKTGEWRGSLATLRLALPGNGNAGGIWAAWTPTDPSFYEQPAVRRRLTQTAQRMRDGLFLAEGGANFYTYFPGQPVTLGARVVNLGEPNGEARSGKMTVAVTDSSGRVMTKRSWPLTPAGGGSAAEEYIWNPPAAWPARGYTVTTTLTENGQVVDRLTQPLNVWMPPVRPDWVGITPDGHFALDGRRWRVNGVNYMPSSGIGQEEPALFEQWLSAAAYDPAVAERDLTHIEGLGLNAVSVFLYDGSIPAQNLLDLLRRCREHHLRVNLSLRPVVSNYLQEADRDEAERRAWQTFSAIITYYHLAQNNTVFAYDIDWEPDFARYGRQRRTDADWAAWTSAHYGSVAAAEAAWGVPAPRDSQGHLTGPSGKSLIQAGGPETKLIAAYRRFLDDWLAETYGIPARRIRALAPHQYVSFRMTGASDPLGDDGGESYQFEGLARALDFLSPESYGQVGTRDGDLAIPFRVAYGRSVAPHAPILWAETGMSVWNLGLGADDPDALATQGASYAKFYDLARSSGADGIVWWWYPGGFRVGENSDFGLINPDGTDRPATAVVRREGRGFLAAPSPPVPDVWLDYDRDQHPDGTVGVFRALKTPFADALARGQHPGLRAKTQP